MKYINTAKVRKLVSITKRKIWLKPNQIIDLSPTDAKLLQANAKYVVPYSLSKNQISSKLVENNARSELKDYFQSMKKDRLVQIAEEKLEISISKKLKKDEIIETLLKESKSKGYDWVLKKI